MGLITRLSLCETKGLVPYATTLPPITPTTKAGRLLADKIHTKTARVGVVGLGYVGLPLAVEYAAAGYHVVGIDLDAVKIGRVNAGDSYVGDVPSSAMGPLVKAGRL